MSLCWLRFFFFFFFYLCRILPAGVEADYILSPTVVWYLGAGLHVSEITPANLDRFYVVRLFIPPHESKTSTYAILTRLRTADLRHHDIVVVLDELCRPPGHRSLLATVEPRTYVVQKSVSYVCPRCLADRMPHCSIIPRSRARNRHILIHKQRCLLLPRADRVPSHQVRRLSSLSILFLSWEGSELTREHGSRYLFYAVRPDGTCHSRVWEAHVLYSFSAFGIVSDISLTALPIWIIIKNLRLSRVKALQVSLIFGAGIFSVWAGVMRLVLMIKTDITTDM